MRTNRNDKQGGKQLGVCAVFFRLLPVCFAAGPLYMIVNILMMSITGLVNGTIILLTQRFLDAGAGFAGGAAGMGAVLTALALLTLAHAGNHVLTGIGNYTGNSHHLKIVGALRQSLNKKAARLAPPDFEKTEVLNHLNKAEQGSFNAASFIMTSFVIFAMFLPYFGFIAWYLFSLKPLLALALAAAFVPAALIQFLRVRVFTKLEDASAPVRREADYYERCITDREFFKETRFLGAYRYFKRLLTDCIALLNRLRWKHEVKANGAELAMKLLTLAAYTGVIYLLFAALMKRDISVGTFAAVYASIDQLFRMMNDVITIQIGSNASRLGTIRNYFAFMDLPERKGADLAVPKTEGIGLENVSFSYPASETKAVDSLSFDIKGGETLAIVGENGSGKTTLVRLITGLYLPGEGAVLIGGVNTTEASMQSLFERSSAVFQNYRRYQMTLKENVGISQLHEQGGETDGGEKLERSCANADVEMGLFPEGYDTMLSREFDGIDLSGGQWQRVAIARGLYRDHDLIVLDEPTAAIDPLEETKIYNRFAEITRDKTAIIVTHRMASVRLADRILVMKQGRLVETGTHDELVKAGGEYERLFRAQEQWYT
ncbi:MAG: ABC transporter ATP-binding protein/permease [Treponema sp.]|jgi:ATP-binding cassette subfamily B protein|nr:ABC transporter ATP-binding protein/permease [Treponema sp.]